MKPTVCCECSAPMWVVGAHSWPNGRWEVGLVCPARECPGWHIYGSEGKLGTNRNRLAPTLSRVMDCINRALEHKRRHGARQDGPQKDVWAAKGA